MKTSVLVSSIFIYLSLASVAFSSMEPVLVNDLNTHTRNLLRYMSPDGLTAFIMHTNTAGGNWVPYSQTRPNLETEFGAPQRFPFSSIGYQPSIVATPDLKTIYCSATDTVTEYTRSSVNDEFGNGRVLSALSNGFYNVGPSCISSDSLRLYLYLSTTTADGGIDIAVATRNSIEEDFGVPSSTLFDALNTVDYVDARPILSPDELELVFVSNRPGMGDGDMYYAQRSFITDPFSIPVPLVDLNTAYGEAPCSWLGDTLYFTQNDDSISCDIYMATIPEPATLLLLGLGGYGLLRRRKRA